VAGRPELHTRQADWTQLLLLRESHIGLRLLSFEAHLEVPNPTLSPGRAMDQTWDRQQLGRAASADPDVRNALSTIRRRAKRLSALEQKPVSRRSRSSAGRQPSTRRSAERQPSARSGAGRQPSARSGAGRQPSMQSTMHAEMSFGEVTEREAGTLALRSSAPAARPYDKPKGQAPRRSAASAAPGKAGLPWKSTENKDLLAFVCHRCNACTAYHNGVSEICGTSLKNCPWVIAKSRAVRQVNAHFAGHEKAEPEPSARRESNYALLCRSGFLGAEPIQGTGLPPPTERTPRTVNVTHQRGTYIVPHKVSCHDIAAIWVAVFSRSQRYRC